MADVYEHWQQAERLIEIAEGSDFYLDGEHGRQLDRIIAMAQVHATLAIGRRVE